MGIEQDTIRGISQKLEQLERSNRRLRWAAGGLLAALACLTLLGASRVNTPTATPSLISAREFVLVDQAGRPLARLGNEKGCPKCSPAPGLVILDSKGKPSAYFQGGAAWLGSGLKSTIMSPGLLSLDQGHTSASLTVENDLSTLTLGCVFGCGRPTPIAQLQSTPFGADLSFQKHFQETINLGTFDTGGRLQMWDAAGKCPSPVGKICAPEFSLTTESQGPLLFLQDLQGYSMYVGASSTRVPETGATTTNSAASIVLWGRPDNNGRRRVIWHVP